MPTPVEDALGEAGHLCEALRQLAAGIGTGSGRVRELTAVLGIDKSTASRLARGLRAEDVAGAVREMPAIEGLGRFIEACAAGGADRGAVERALGALERFEGAVREIPGGRAGLVTALAGPGDVEKSERASPEASRARARAERAARRAAFDAARFLQGITVDESVYGLFIGPGSRPDRLHQAVLNAALGIRRLRPGPPITVGGLLGSPLQEGAPTRVSLGGAALGNDAREAMLTEFCVGAEGRLRVDRQGRAYRMWVGEDDPPIDEPMSVVYGMRMPDFIERVKSERYRWACINYQVRRPTRRLTLEVFVHAPGLSPPRLVMSMEPGRTPDPIGGPPADGRELLEQTSRLVPMGRGLERRGSASSDAHLPMFRRALELLGWDASTLERYRLEVEYPISFVEMQVWMELADA